MRCTTIAAALLAALLWPLPAALAGEEPAVAKYEPTANYPQQKVCGWTVYVNHRLLEDKKELGDRVLRQLEVKLYEINRMVPAGALEKLHQIPIWLEYHHPGHSCACYHPDRQWLVENDFNPEKVDSVEIANAVTFLDWIRQQPSMVLHELAHGYHDRCLEGGYDNAELEAAYQRAKEGKSYDAVLRYNATTARAYAMNNPMEYFAELSEAWFGTNDFYPFVRAEVIQHDPEMAKLLEKLWGQ